MAIYHLSMSVISRKAGRSATASAAYCSADKIVDERTREVYDYTRKRGVVHSEIVLPQNAPAWARQRAALWNAVEQHNRRADAVVARAMTLALPHELTDGQRRQLVSGFARHLADRYQIGVDVAIHRPSGADARNHHAHLLLTANRLDPTGLGVKVRDLDPIARARAGAGENATEQLRQAWEQQANHALDVAGHAQRIDHRTLEAQGVDREPTQHLGPAATEYERRTGKPSRRRLETEASRELAEINRELNQTKRDLERTTLYVGDLEDAQRERAQALAEERAEWARRRQAEEQQARERQAQQARADQERIEQMTAQELVTEIKRLTPRPVEDVLQERPELVQARAQTEQFWRQALKAHDAASLARYEAEQWRKAHPVRARLHDAGVTQAYLTQREHTEREQSQQEQTLTRQMRVADYQARQVLGRLHPLIVAEQAPIWARIAELERLQQAKTAQEPVQERLPAARPRQTAPKDQERLQAAQKPLETALERHQAAPPPQPLPPPTLEPTATQKPLQTAPEGRQATQERPLTALEQEKAQQLREAVKTLDKRSAMLRFPELIQLYPLVAHAARYAEEYIPNAENRAAFVEGIKERGIRELAQGKALPKPSIPPEPKIERTRERDYGPSL